MTWEDPSIKAKPDWEESTVKTLADASKLLAKQADQIEDSAISLYLRELIDYLKAKGENLEDYYLVRENGTMTFDDGHTFKQGVYYGLKHKDSIKKVESRDD